MKNANDQHFFNFVGAKTKGYTILELEELLKFGSTLTLKNYTVKKLILEMKSQDKLHLDFNNSFQLNKWRMHLFLFLQT